MKQLFYMMKWPVVFAILALIFTACEKDDPIPENEPYIPGSHGVFILNEGSMGKNNAGLSYFNFETGNTTTDILSGKLGDTGQDMLAYGSKLYVSVNESAYIRVVDLYARASVDSIALKDGSLPLKPRYLAAYEGKIYATISAKVGSVVRIDTATLKVEAVTKVGSYPEGIVAVNGKLYVANGGQGAGNTLSVVDIAGFREERTITVGINPYIIRADKYGDLYLTYQGDFGEDTGGMQRIDTKTGSVTQLAISANRNFVIDDDLLYFFGVTYNADYSVNGSFGVFDVKTETLTANSIISDGTKIDIPYGIGVNPQTKDVYIADTDYATPGTIYIFGQDGKNKKSIRTGINPNTFVFY
ncbi:MAG: hypothetical protein LBU22_03565 [Dysgonamonadaceae bacterium]|jgi:YVTN family beta-propeller protein|nr:hypothetical protein [Dysgonamonadaceae bacterium]